MSRLFDSRIGRMADDAQVTLAQSFGVTFTREGAPDVELFVWEDFEVNRRTNVQIKLLKARSSTHIPEQTALKHGGRSYVVAQIISLEHSSWYECCLLYTSPSPRDS